MYGAAFSGASASGLVLSAAPGEDVVVTGAVPVSASGSHIVALLLLFQNGASIWI